ncbi:unnamed protein product [Acanthosepion pharaonis]|uniref:Uncharacterized protein n=1 Tax=Acanthosepion pharaonis TaxID=158019 RepID=A0A812ANB6_ACAPH|nr:unnamed protein product [Sepia pharaonis]
MTNNELSAPVKCGRFFTATTEAPNNDDPEQFLSLPTSTINACHILLKLLNEYPAVGLHHPAPPAVSRTCSIRLTLPAFGSLLQYPALLHHPARPASLASGNDLQYPELPASSGSTSWHHRTTPAVVGTPASSGAPAVSSNTKPCSIRLNPCSIQLQRSSGSLLHHPAHSCSIQHSCSIRLTPASSGSLLQYPALLHHLAHSCSIQNSCIIWLTPAVSRTPASSGSLLQHPAPPPFPTIFISFSF